MSSRLRFASIVLLACAVGAGAACAASKDKGAAGDGQPDSGTVTLPDGQVVEPDGAPAPDGGVPGDDSGTTTNPPTDSGTTTNPPTDSGTTNDATTDTGTGGPTVTYQLAITPANTTVTLPAGASSSTVDFYTSLVPSTGITPPTDVTASTTFTIDDTSIGTFSGHTLTFVKPGTTIVRATSGGYVMATNFTVVGPQVIYGPGATAGDEGKFGGGGGGSAPTIVYPANGVMLPPNMNVFEFQFLPGAGNTLFELAFKGTNVDLKVYFGCTAAGSGCGYTPDANAWKYLAEGGRGQTPVTYTLRAVNGSSPGAVGAAPAQTMSFGLENIVGGVYYWNAGAGATMRYEFGVSGASAETWMNAPKAGALICVGCHSISRPGHRIALGLDNPGTNFKVFDVATRTTVFGGSGQSFYTFSPDEKQIVVNNGATLTLANAATGAAIAKLADSAAQPDWSADGQHIVYAKINHTCDLFHPCVPTGIDQGNIALLNWNGSSWAAGPTLVGYAGQNNYYPTFVPDGSFVVFNRSPSNQGSYDAYDAQVWAVPTSGGAAVRLANASTGGDSWPKTTPEVQRYRNGGKLVWVTFSSRRPYGLLLNTTPPPDPTKPNTTAQIWMTAIDPAKIAAGQDGSYPAFWFPFQDMGSGNHIAQWVKKVERLTCATGATCATGEQCLNGVCVGGIR